MTCRLYDIDVYMITHVYKLLSSLPISIYIHHLPMHVHPIPTVTIRLRDDTTFCGFLWLSVAPCTACNSENCPPQPRASWPSTFQILSVANWIFQNRESGNDVSRIISSPQNGFRRRRFNGRVLRLSMWKSRHKIWEYTLALLNCVILHGYVGIFYLIWSRGMLDSISIEVKHAKLRSFSFSSPLTELISQLKLNRRWNLVEPSG